MIRISAAILLLTATAASAEPFGAAFCQHMKDNFDACIEELQTTNSDGQFLNECPKTIRLMDATYEISTPKVPPSRRPAFERAHKAWEYIAYRIGWHVGESDDAYEARLDKYSSDIDTECANLEALD